MCSSEPVSSAVSRVNLNLMQKWIKFMWWSMYIYFTMDFEIRPEYSLCVYKVCLYNYSAKFKCSYFVIKILQTWMRHKTEEKLSKPTYVVSKVHLFQCMSHWQSSSCHTLLTTDIIQTQQYLILYFKWFIHIITLYNTCFT
jgi:hypothetical protein